MDAWEKLKILGDAAKYDVACTSSGVDRNATAQKLGNAVSAGCCHSFTPDGRCVSLLKVLMTNSCIYDCAYCVNRKDNDSPRVAFKPQELADITIEFYRRNYIEGLFLSSGVLKDPDYTTELMIETLRLLREVHDFRGYIHAKAIPGASPDLTEQLGHLCDRISLNLELPSQASLEYLAPCKGKHNLLTPMKQIRDSIATDRDTRSLMRKETHYIRQVETPKKERAFAPAGQSTQIIIGATPETDYQILMLTGALYKQLRLKRTFFSAYLPVNKTDSRLPQGSNIQLNREHRLYQADWMLRFYGYDVNEIIDPNHPFLDPLVDPKANWALNNLDVFPVEVNTAPYEMLLRVPGIGVKGAKHIMKARKTHTLRGKELQALGIAYKRARFFITCNRKYDGLGVEFSPEGIRPYLAQRIKGGEHGPRSKKVIPGQLSLFEENPLETHAQEIITPALPAPGLQPAQMGAELFWHAAATRRIRS